LIISLSYSGFCFSAKRYLSKGELLEIAVYDAYSSIFYQPDTFTIRNENRSWQKVREFVRSNRSCCTIIHSFGDYLSSEEYRIKAGNYEGYLYPSFLGRLVGCESYLVEIRYVGTKQVHKQFETAGPRVVYRVLGACGSVRKYL